MSVAGCLSEGPVSGAGTGAQPRALGAASVAVAHIRGATRISDLAQSGSAKCLLPRVEGAAEAIFLNTAGGITGGDRFSFAARAGARTHLVCTTQTAERLYRVQPGTEGRVEIRLEAAAGATLEWLAQETIVFDRAAVARSIEADIAADARLTVVDGLVLGRTAMGETVHEARLTDRWRIRRAGRLVFADGLRLIGPVAEITARPALWGGARAAATVIHVAPDAADRLDAVRALLPCTAGASVRDGVLVIRVLANDGQRLRNALLTVVTGLRQAALPRVWTM